MQNYLGGLHTHTWTLGIEEHFYLGLVLLIALLIRFCPLDSGIQSNWFLVGGFIVVMACACSRWFFLTYFPDKPVWVIMHSHNRIDSLLIGVMLSWLMWQHAGVSQLLERYRWVLSIIALLVISSTLFIDLIDHLYYTIWWYPSLALAFAILIGVAVSTDFKITAILNPICWIEVYSYTIYLWHFPAESLIRNHFYNGNIPIENIYAYIILYCIISCVAGYLFAVALELPMLRLRERFFPSAQSPLPSKK